MDFLQDLKIFSVPGWVKATLVVLLAGLGIINTTVFAVGLLNDSHREGWIKASVDLLGVLLPIFLITLVAWQANTGVEALRRVTEDFFLGILPDVLGRTAELEGVFFEAHRGQKLTEYRTNAKILTNLRRGNCYADILIFLPNRGEFIEILIRIEMNVHKVNLNICFDRELLAERLPSILGDVPALHGQNIRNDQHTAKWIREVFAHTLGGALHPGVGGDVSIQMAEPDSHDKSGATRLVYEFNDLMINRVVFDRRLRCLVAAIALPKDFLWEGSERLYFAQDLMFFLRSCITERPDLFRSFTHDEMLDEIERLRTLNTSRDEQMERPRRHRAAADARGMTGSA